MRKEKLKSVLMVTLNINIEEQRKDIQEIINIRRDSIYEKLPQMWKR